MAGLRLMHRLLLIAVTCLATACEGDGALYPTTGVQDGEAWACLGEPVEIEFKWVYGCGGSCPGQAFEFEPLSANLLAVVDASIGEFNTERRTRTLTLTPKSVGVFSVRFNGTFESLTHQAAFQLHVEECGG